jgi:AraC-like DNA-binding protein
VAARPFVVASDLALPAVDAMELYADGSPELRHLGEGDDFLFLGGHVSFDAEHAQLLMDSLPPFAHLPASGTEAGTLSWLIRRLVTERRALRPGVTFASVQLAQLMFLEILRAFVDSTDDKTANRLRLITNRRLSPALQRIHAEPARAWQLEELAKLTGMSRTAFAVHFKSVAGVAPLAYLTEWRMRLAERELRRSDATFAELASTLGYASESAFSTAFKRVMGISPKHYRRKVRHRPNVEAPATLHA